MFPPSRSFFRAAVPYACVNNVNLFYEARGQGRAVLLISGLSCDHRIWAHQAGPLSRHFTVITYDQRGIGKSSAADEDFTFGDLASDAAGLIRELGHEKVSVVGMSMGGAVAQRLAIDHPDAVERLALVCASSRSDSTLADALKKLRQCLAEGADIFARELARITFAEAYRTNHARQVDMTAALLAENAGRGGTVLRQMALLADFDFRRELSALSVPALVIAGGRDELSPPRLSEEIAGLMPNCACSVIEGAGHGLAMERAGEFNGLLLGFL